MNNQDYKKKMINDMIIEGMPTTTREIFYHVISYNIFFSTKMNMISRRKEMTLNVERISNTSELPYDCHSVCC